MERKKKVLLALARLCREKAPAGQLEIGFTAQEVAREAGIIRSNASGDLNYLVKEGLVVKFPGRPVRFVTRQYWEESKARNGREDTGRMAVQEIEMNPFTSLLGWNSSLKVAVEQARAALLYPPHGLHTLLIGPTGSGKTLFARTMFRYAQTLGRVTGQAQLVSFNCADYAHNPQLLMSQLFGHVKGAFTGAAQEKPGLVDAAHKSILFLDEIHRLPPEGQEMLFYLMDNGQYRRLGETGSYRSCTTLVIGATTADPHSSLLATFYRRFPVVINIPALAERPLAERLLLLKQLLAGESRQIGRPLKVTADAIRALLLYDCPGNIGQLFNDIRLTCARAFLDATSKGTREVVITAASLPPHVQPRSAAGDNYLQELAGLVLEEEWYIEPDEAGVTAACQVPDLYTLLEKEREANGVEGINNEVQWKRSRQALEEYYHRYLKETVQDWKNARLRLARLVGQDIIALAQEAVKIAREDLPGQVDTSTFLALALHLNACRQRLKAGQEIVNPYLEEIQKEYPREIEVARKVMALIEKKLNLALPPDEAGFLAMLFRAGRQGKEPAGEPVGVVVMAHGSRTATSMAEVANKLVGTNAALALDIPLEGEPQQWLIEATRVVRQADRGRGVLLLVDMEPLISWGEIIAKRTGLKIHVLDNVTTAMVIEAVRKASRFPLHELVAEIGKYHYLEEYWPLEGQGNKIIVATCLTGEGAARRIKAMIREWLGDREEINIVTVNMNGQVTGSGMGWQALKGKGKLVAVIGSVDLKIPDVPFISLEEWLLGQGRWRLQELLQLPAREQDITPQELEAVLAQYLRFLEPGKMLDLCSQITRQLSQSLGRRLLPHHKINLIVHLSCLVERLQAGEQGSFWPGEEEIKRRYPREWLAVAEAMAGLEKNFNITIPTGEIAFVVQFLQET
ncbi:sigma 54-interacting transcriptional regulator [Neomoorella mulderi]|uniref:Nitric oxide reductase transcription regulator NorR2 n=1 Tax=Moorella mulderi DSM 14980 TaxID=1122241 RepID=A0A151B142_9FIRM|nr:sigma-54-dependent transcriptional regulator [Moorella mulderi]KYH33503.1 nitric oxide reductase transcription regulator NorR2 [Moorella mulderi DSM 14980]